MKNLHSSVCALGAVLLFTACSSGSKPEDSAKIAEQQNEAKFDNTGSGTNTKDNGADFLVEAAGINLEEIELGKMAETKGSAADVKELGKMMNEQHKTAYDDLKKLADSKSITIPDMPTQDAQDAYKKLSEEKGGKDFDKKFCSMMVDGHEKAIKKFETCSEKCGDADVKAWADKMLPTLKMHLEHAKACKDAVDGKKM
ncbi:MAG: DUF4142 domain-containing protein [Bacteroidia bacterium]